MKKIILGIETSCDDTSMALIEGDPHDLLTPPKVIAHKTFSQDEQLKEWGGVVPEIAARNHMEKLIPLYSQLLKTAELTIKDVNLIGVTTLPGLLGPLLTGLGLAKTLSLFHQIGIVPVNHLFAHLEAIHLTHSISYPYLGLLISGGHGLFFLVQNRDQFEILGSTTDDAPGEAFDKAGRILGLGYPAGKIIDQLAQNGNPLKYSFPIGLKELKSPQMSFSGVKTSLRYFLEENDQIKTPQNPDGPYSPEFYDVVASYQHAIIMALKLKLERAKEVLKKRGPAFSHLPIVVGGGVASNSYLRKVFQNSFSDLFFVSPIFCTDNGAMIANYAFRHYHKMVPYPESLEIDAKGRFIDKKEIQKGVPQ